MSRELDVRVAELVMGEPEPDPYMSDVPGTYGNSPENWVCVRRPMNALLPLEWKPLPFSTSYEHAMRAVDEYLKTSHPDFPEEERYLFAEYMKTAASPWSVTLDSECGLGSTLPEAICWLLLALVKERD